MTELLVEKAPRKVPDFIEEDALQLADGIARLLKHSGRPLSARAAAVASAWHSHLRGTDDQDKDFELVRALQKKAHDAYARTHSAEKPVPPTRASSQLRTYEDISSGVPGAPLLYNLSVGLSKTVCGPAPLEQIDAYLDRSAGWKATKARNIFVVK